jgi:hypothetical protein
VRTITRLNRYHTLTEQRENLREMADRVVAAQEQERQQHLAGTARRSWSGSHHPPARHCATCKTKSEILLGRDNSANNCNRLYEQTHSKYP